MFKIKVDPTFESEVEIPRPGGRSDVLKVVFRHKGKDDLDAYFKLVAKKKLPDEEALLLLIESWDADMELNKQSMKALINENHPATKALYDTYLAELQGARKGN